MSIKNVICAKVCRAQTDVNSASTVSFADIENSMYKRRQLNQPALPTTVDDVDRIIAASRYAATRTGRSTEDVCAPTTAQTEQRVYLQRQNNCLFYRQQSQHSWTVLFYGAEIILSTVYDFRYRSLSCVSSMFCTDDQENKSSV